jgi:two-component system alkaline phosphatase synthesis response regulator PhoP
MDSEPSKTVVCIEDDPEFLDLMQLMLHDVHIHIVPAIGGHAGLEAVRQHRPDLVLLDLMMPDMNGWDVCMKMRSDEALRNIPVIVVTALSTRYDRMYGERVAKVADYITKPFMPSQLRNSVAAVLA